MTIQARIVLCVFCSAFLVCLLAILLLSLKG